MANIEKLIYTNERGEIIEFSLNSIYHTNISKDVTGIENVNNEIFSYSSIGQDGETYLGSRIESRSIEIIGHIKTINKDEMLPIRRKLAKILNPQLNATLTYQYGDFERIIDCKVDNAPIFNPKSIFNEFTIILSCLNPFWRELKDSRQDIATWTGGFSFECEISITDGMIFGNREPSVIVNVTNDGDVKSGIKVAFKATGTVVNPSIINVETGEFIKTINLTMSAGDILSISTYYGKKSVELISGDTVTNGFRYLDSESTFLQLALGDNLLKYDADVTPENLDISIYHNNNYLGV